MKNESRYFNNSNLSLVDISRDSNGNKVVKVQFGDERAFSIQTLNNLRKTHAMLAVKQDIHELSDAQLNTIEKECVKFIQEHGSQKQKERLRVYSEGGLSGTPKNKPKEQKEAKLTKELADKIHAKILKVEPSSLSKLRELVDKYNVFYQIELVRRWGIKQGVKVVFTQNSKKFTRPLKDYTYGVTDWD